MENSTSKKVHLIVSDEKEPNIIAKPGMKFEVVVVQLVNPKMEPSAPIAKATLCGSDSSCVAIIEL